jgi:6-phosphofructokinase 1
MRPLMKHIAVLTSGGDAPGMNAAIRAIVRTAAHNDLRVSGIYHGYQGLIDEKIIELGTRNVTNIIQLGGTILRTARSELFFKAEGRALAAQVLEKRGIDGLLVIGGDGSFRGASQLYKEHGVPIIGIPGTIDNDIFGTELSIGFNTAINVGLEFVDRLRDTAASHDRLFLVEVMGRDSGNLALHVGLAGGADAIIIPEHNLQVGEAAELVMQAEKRGKSSSIVVVAEGAYEGGVLALQEAVRKRSELEVRSSILGHVQRGGSPSTQDRILASRLGYEAVLSLKAGKAGVMIGVDKSETVFPPLSTVGANKKEIDWHLVRIAQVVAQ